MLLSINFAVLPASQLAQRHTVPGLHTENVMELTLEELDQEPGLQLKQAILLTVPHQQKRLVGPSTKTQTVVQLVVP
jgi:hypothetical protein